MDRARIFRSLLSTALAVAALAAGGPGRLAADQWRTVDTESLDILIEQPTRLKQLDPVFTQSFLPFATGHSQKITSMVQLFPVDPTLFNFNRAKGRVRATASCLGPQVQHDLGTRSKRVDRNGNAAFTFEADSALGCEVFLVEWEFLKRFQLPAGDVVTVKTGVELVDDGADPDCFDDQLLCLNSDRFQVEVDWKDFSGQEGNAVAFPRSDLSGTFFFFDPDNTELLLKVLDGCAFNGHFWVFFSATTDVEYTLTVTDTDSGQSRVYDNPLGGPSPAITDTQAFATCP